jgi:hypothetical protein
VKSICGGESIAVPSRSCSVDGQVCSQEQASNKDAHLTVDEQHHILRAVTVTSGEPLGRIH